LPILHRQRGEHPPDPVTQSCDGYFLIPWQPIFRERRDHELKALWEWLQATQRRVAVLGIFGPLSRNASGNTLPHSIPEMSGRLDSVELNPQRDLGWYRQSAAFVVL
jgi:hypothetical protein